MDVMEIIRDAFEFPSENAQVFLIYVVLSIVASVFSAMGTLISALGFLIPECFLWGGMALIVSMLIGWVLSGYSVSVIKSGIDHDDEVPEFEWWDNFITGFNNFIVTIVYFAIPAFIVVVVGYLTNIYGNVMALAHEIYLQSVYVYMGASTIAVDAIAQAMVNLVMSLAVTITVALVLYVIFSFLQTMAEARLANTGSLTEALNVFEAAKDIARIGVSKVIIVIVLVIVIVVVIEVILYALFSYALFLAVLSIIVTPYLILFTQRAVGLLYSDIA